MLLREFLRNRIQKKTTSCLELSERFLITLAAVLPVTKSRFKSSQKGNPDLRLQMIESDWLILAAFSEIDNCKFIDDTVDGRNPADETAKMVDDSCQLCQISLCSQYHPMYTTKLLQAFFPIHLPSAQDSKSPANVARFDSHTFQLNERSIEAIRRLGFFLIDARGCNYIIPWINPTLETFATESLQQLVPSCDMAKSFKWGQATNFCESIESLDPNFQQLHAPGTCGFHHVKRRKLSSSQSRSQHRPLGIATSCRVKSLK